MSNISLRFLQSTPNYQPFDYAWLSQLFNISIKDVSLELLAEKSFSRVFIFKHAGKKYFIKQNPRDFVQEGLLIQYLCTITHDNNLPYCIGHDSYTNTFIMRAIEGALKNELSKFDAYAVSNVISAYINMQLNTDVSLLYKFNCRDFNTPDLYNMMKDTFSKILPWLSSVNALKLETVIKGMYRIKPVFEQLNSFDIPDTLEHADFHLGNVLSRVEQPVFIDFAESAIACPLFSFISFKDSLTKRYNLLPDDLVLDKLTSTYIKLMSSLLDIPSQKITDAITHADIIYPFYYILTMREVLRVHYEETGSVVQNARLSNTIHNLFKLYA